MSLGARRLRDLQAGKSRWTTFADIEGNESDLIAGYVLPAITAAQAEPAAQNMKIGGQHGCPHTQAAVTLIRLETASMNGLAEVRTGACQAQPDFRPAARSHRWPGSRAGPAAGAGGAGPAASQVLLVTGEAGMGKTVLLADAAGRARSAGMRVLSVTGRESESKLAFAGLHQLLRPVLSSAAGLPGRQAQALPGALGLAADPVLRTRC